MKILVACEESQAVTIELRRIGHEAYSCDIEPCSGGHPEWHIQADVLPVLNGRCDFDTADGTRHNIAEKWDMIIAFPPCTYLTAAGAVRLYNGDHTIRDPERDSRGRKAAKFFYEILNADCPKIAVENPVPMKRYGLPPYSQVIEPYMFGHPWKKRTCLWLQNLPPLMATDIMIPEGLWVGSTSANRDPTICNRYKLHSNRNSKRRAKTFPGIAKAMAEQWAGDIREGSQCEK